MSLIKSISGTRGTIGGRTGDNLTAQDIAEMTAAYAQWLINSGESRKVVVGRDARISGEMVSNICVTTLRMMGIDVIDLGLSTTPTVEMIVTAENAGGGIVLTASHNPRQWNALKFLNFKGEFISAEDGAEILRLASTGEVYYADVDKLGSLSGREDHIQYHIDQIMAMPLVNAEEIKKRQFRVVVDCINSTGAISIPPLLRMLGCEVITMNAEMNGRFNHNPEPLPEHLTDLASQVIFHRAHLGVAVDPDVDRLVLISENGEPFGEEYTLVAVADYVLTHRPGNTVSNLSSTQALRVVTEKHGGQYFAAAVGEVNVVAQMKEVKAVIGGEGNGGVICPDLHYGRDALAGLALFLSHLALSGKSASMLRGQYPNYFMSKNKITLDSQVDLEKILGAIKDKYTRQEIIDIDGVKIFFDGDWIHLRRSNTEPIIRIYSESASEVTANALANKIKADISELIR